jgi:hypothetical protein
MRTGREQLLVETLLRVGLDLHLALELSSLEPVDRQLRGAVGDVDEAVRRVQRAALENEEDFVIAHAVDQRALDS